MQTNKKILVNVISSGAQIGLIGIVYLFLYRLLVKELGVEQLGVWSVVLATTSLANLANFGVSSSVVRYVALYMANGSYNKIHKLIFTGSSFLLILFIALSLIVYPFANFILSYVINSKYIALALKIIPFSISCLIINEVSGVFASVLDGLQKNYLRSIIYTISSIILLIGAYIWTPKYGLEGVAIAQVVQSLFTLISCLIVVIKITHYNPLKWLWDKAIFKEIFAYGMKFQFLSLTAMLLEPITKSFLAKFGGLAFTGYYEMATRLVNQLRGVIVNSVQSLLPVMVNFSINDPHQQKKLYKVTMNIVYAVSLMFFSLLLISSNTISSLWIGQIQPIFLYSVLILSLSSFSNLLCSPAYFAYIAEGKLNNPIYSQLIAALLNLIIGFALGHVFKGNGVVIGWAIAVCLGSFYLSYCYQKQYKIKPSDVFRKDWIGFSILILVIFYIKLFFTKYNVYLIDTIFFLLVLSLFGIMFYRIYKNRDVYFR